MQYRHLAAVLLVCGVTSAQAQFLIGQTAGYTGPVASGVQETTEGAKLWVDHINSKGGVHGEKVELVALDDKFDPKQAAENTRILIEEKGVTAMFLTRGTAQTLAVIPQLDKHAVALVAPSTGAMSLHKPVQKYVFNVRATYQLEARKAVAHLVTLGLTKIAIAYRDDAFGTDALTGAQLGFADAKIVPVATEKWDANKPDFAAVSQKVKGAQAVMIFGATTQLAELVSALRKNGSTSQVLTLSNNASAGTVKALGEHARGVVVAQVFPNERTLAVPLVREAAELAKSKSLEVSPAILEGFAAAKVLVEGLRRMGPRAKGEPIALTRSRFVAALDQMKSYDLGGLEISFSPTDHTGLDFSDLSIIDAQGRFRR